MNFTEYLDLNEEKEFDPALPQVSEEVESDFEDAKKLVAALNANATKNKAFLVRLDMLRKPLFAVANKPYNGFYLVTIKRYLIDTSTAALPSIFRYVKDGNVYLPMTRNGLTGPNITNGDKKLADYMKQLEDNKIIAV
jgi:hypothetical protein